MYSHLKISWKRSSKWKATLTFEIWKRLCNTFSFFVVQKTNKSFPQNGKIHWISKIISKDFSLQKLNSMKMQNEMPFRFVQSIRTWKKNVHIHSRWSFRTINFLEGKLKITYFVIILRMLKIRCNQRKD